jgi:hypothetical protein
VSARGYIILLSAIASVLAAPSARAGDLGDALAWIEDNAGAEHTKGFEDEIEAQDDGAIAMINARDVVPNKPLEAYGCDDSPVDQAWVLRTNGHLRWNDRACHEAQWNRSSLPGYRTLGRIKLSHNKVASWIDVAAERTHVSVVLIDTIIRFSSGYRPGVVKDDGTIGIMQIRPEFQAGLHGVDLLDPRANILAGAKILRDLLDQYGTVELALIAFHAGPQAAWVRDDFEVGLDRDTFWFVREVRRIVRAFEAEFPTETGVDSVEYIWRWLDWPSERGEDASSSAGTQSGAQ